MNQFKSVLPFFFVLILTIGCKKEASELKAVESNQNKINIPSDFFVESKVPGIETGNSKSKVTIAEASAPDSVDLNNGDVAIILGNQLVNPYTVGNMQLAANIIYGGSAPTLTANHKYVRFKPSDPSQFDLLQSDQDLELQDYPMDYELIQDGDYYQDPNLGTEEIGWLYAVVPISYVQPEGIQYQVISTLYLTDNSTLEDMAESLVAGISYSQSQNENGTVTITREDNGISITMRPPRPCDLLPVDDPNYCGPGDGGGGGVPPAVNAGIFVQEQTLCGFATTDVPVKKLRVVAKRWFKIWRGYTDNNGDFTVTKRFKNNVKVIVKTKNNEAVVSKVRGLRLWQMLFPVKKRIGVFNNSDLPNIRYVFNKPVNATASNKDLPYWVAATTHNSIVEFREYTNEFGLTQPPNDLRVLITNLAQQTGSAPMFNKCSSITIPAVWITTFVISTPFIGTIAGGIFTIVNTLKNRVDLTLAYNSTDFDCLLTSPQIKSIVYHEMGHAMHYNQAGCDFWVNYRTAIITELSKLDQIQFHPYGTGNDASTAPIIATGEMWGNHCEKWYGERHYGGALPRNVLSNMQGTFFRNDGSPTIFYAGEDTDFIFGLNANYGAIEGHNPDIGIWQWIPQGLCYDLIDNRNDGAIPIIDNVNGFTINQCFAALQSDVRSIPEFRNRMILQNPNNQQAQIIELFQEYDY